MTTTMQESVQQHRVWSTMPGWGIAADLTPPELADRRRLRTLRKLTVVGLALLLIICAAAVAASMTKATAAEDSLRAAEDRSSALVARQSEFGDVVKVQSDTAAIDAQIAELMKNDVDVASLMLALRDRLPGSMSITSINVTLGAGQAAEVTPTPESGQAAGNAAIGTVNLAGTSQALSDLATYVSNLERLDGVQDVLPESNAMAEAGGASWSITLKLNQTLYTHRYDVDDQSGGSQ